ncbi:Maf family protein [Chitinophaga sancti]|uniref:dTTP/UTP pyrophosphatase n=1 Tax=Chitinophaga sancti TaxID=1004 RepID=A0A1K1PTV4_9BACT|nr:Maf family protein [Chitinophaga sancti]WQD61656.1 Maf family protein [Chitinophaga sancti]WQG92787.1 Maf family protein [Chitinophaga sancti]SFW50899.1 septum formation protein [Chitinophaga sancti]
MYTGKRVILGSQSPRRKQLLEQAGIPFEVKVVDTAETFPADMHIPDIPVHIARQKAIAVAPLCKVDDIIITADTVVVLDDTIIGKPRDREDAIRILSALSGREHRVITGVIILRDGQEEAFSKETAVHFKPLTTAQITYYVDNFKPYDKAGAYAIQEWIGAVGIDRIDGCFYNVMGLPVSNVVEKL